VRIAAIDIGSNSIRSRIVEVSAEGMRRTLDEEKAYTRLGRGMVATGRLSKEAMADALVALERMLHIAERHDVTRVRAVATAAVRQATNGQKFVARVRDELGLQIEVISAEEEGRLAFLSAAESVGTDGRCTVIDIGGGSMEVVRASDGVITMTASLPVGAVVMSERYHTVDPMPKKQVKHLARHVRRTLAAEIGTEPESVGLLVGSGGTVSAVARLIAATRRPDVSSVHTFEIHRDDLAHVRAALVRSSAEERLAMKGMPESRVDIIVAGAVVLDETVRVLGAETLVVNSRGMREGIVIDTVMREGVR
jgi:exopolyphosphatase / guanosine-5'-triphosphate,3'-diphosphate pyrophosphatase